MATGKATLSWFCLSSPKKSPKQMDKTLKRVILGRTIFEGAAIDRRQCKHMKAACSHGYLYISYEVQDYRSGGVGDDPRDRPRGIQSPSLQMLQQSGFCSAGWSVERISSFSFKRKRDAVLTSALTPGNFPSALGGLEQFGESQPPLFGTLASSDAPTCRTFFFENSNLKDVLDHRRSEEDAGGFERAGTYRRGVLDASKGCGEEACEDFPGVLAFWRGPGRADAQHQMACLVSLAAPQDALQECEHDHSLFLRERWIPQGLGVSNYVAFRDEMAAYYERGWGMRCNTVSAWVSSNTL
ncbi:hypothetical protein BJ508DRAFT_307452 [Ascobolus immersus RN42]|uniref:Uncharacterized protein n=1 Tax=Ascobolus immersus RN42 TaxID=1160509 RepID=A0A3N4I2X6_ASCIM|nr:hypothetical protein BJ508DRAFT_307452 [Ascobolus immersus RN42]